MYRYNFTPTSTKLTMTTSEENMQSVEKIMKIDKEQQALDLSLSPPNKNGEEIKLELKEEKGAHSKVEENQGTGPGFGHGHNPQFSSVAPGGSAEGSGPGLHVSQGHHLQGSITIRRTAIPSMLVNFSTFAFSLNFSVIK